MPPGRGELAGDDRPGHLRIDHGHVGRTASVASYIQKGVRCFNANLDEWITNGAAIYTDEVKKGLAG